MRAAFVCYLNSICFISWKHCGLCCHDPYAPLTLIHTHNHERVNTNVCTIAATSECVSEQRRCIIVTKQTHTHTCKCSRLICLNQSDRTNDRAHWVCAWKRHSLGVYSHFDIDVYGVVESWCCSIHKCTSYTHSHSYSHISPPVYTISFACESTTCVNVCVCCTYQTNLQRRVVFFDIPYAQSEWVSENERLYANCTVTVYQQ